jgi:hypothetical protein
MANKIAILKNAKKLKEKEEYKKGFINNDFAVAQLDNNKKTTN